MPRISWRTDLLLLGGVAALGAAFTLAAYTAGPMLALAGIVAAAVAVFVLIKPPVGVYLGLLAVPGELATAHFGSSFSLSPTKGLLLLAAAGFVVRFLRGERPPLHAAQIAYGCFLVVAGLGILVAVDPLVVERTLTVWIAAWIITLWVSNADRRELVTLFWCMAISGAVLGVLAAAGSSPQELQQGGAVATGRASGAFTHPNELGDYLVVSLPLSVALGTLRRGWRRWTLYLAAALQAAGLALTLSRGAIFGAIAGGAVLLLWGQYRRIVITALCIALVAFIADPSLIDSGEIQTVTSRLSTVESFSTTSGDRILIWSRTPSMIADHPLLGVGEGNFPDVAPLYGIVGLDATPFDHAHDVLLTVAAETGLLGLAFFVAFCVATAGAAISALRRSLDAELRLLTLALLASALGIAVVSLTDYPLIEFANYAQIMIAAAMLISAARLARAPTSAGAASRAVPARVAVPA